jgi:hypothetical protein
MVRPVQRMNSSNWSAQSARSRAWAWLPLGIRDRFDSADVSADIHFAFGGPAKGPGGFCLSYLQANAAESVAIKSPLLAVVQLGRPQVGLATWVLSASMARSGSR